MLWEIAFINDKPTKHKQKNGWQKNDFQKRAFHTLALLTAEAAAGHTAHVHCCWGGDRNNILAHTNFLERERGMARHAHVTLSIRTKNSLIVKIIITIIITILYGTSAVPIAGPWAYRPCLPSGSTVILPARLGHKDRLDIRKTFFSERVVQWYRLPREVVGVTVPGGV